MLNRVYRVRLRKLSQINQSVQTVDSKQYESKMSQNANSNKNHLSKFLLELTFSVAVSRIQRAVYRHKIIVSDLYEKDYI